MRSLLLILFISSVFIACDRQAPATTPKTSNGNSNTDGGEIQLPAAVEAVSAEGLALPADEMPSSDSIDFEDPWIRLVPAVSPNSAAYVKISNGTEAEVNLTSITSQVADRIEIHDVTTDAAGTMSMSKMDSMLIDPDSEQTLAPGGKHIMIYGLNAPLSAGEVVTMMVAFDNQPPMPVNFTVR